MIPWQPTVKSVSNPFTQGPRSAAGLHLGLMQMNEKEESVPVQVPSVEDNLALSFLRSGIVLESSVMLYSTLHAYLIGLGNFFIGGNIKSLRLPPGKAAAYAVECLFLDRVLHSNGDLPQKHVWEALGVSNNVPINICPNAASEWFRQVASYTADIVAICALAQILKPKVIFEIGTYHGSSAIQLAANAPQASIYTLDLPPNQLPRLRITAVDRYHISRSSRNEFGARIHRLYGDSATFNFSPFRESVDLFFIDGAHSYEYVRNDTLKAMECVKKGSVIAWHDYGRCGVNGVSRWLHEFRKSRDIYRVTGGSLAYMLY